jgi:hypothetical protein
MNSQAAFKVGLLIPSIVLLTAGCGIVGPSCNDESGAVLHAAGEVPAGGVTSYTVVSPKDSNLVLRLTWPDTVSTLGMRATITACGGHTGCQQLTSTPPFGPGGSSPTPQPWPPGLREMRVDGWQGKTYRVEVTGDDVRAATFTLAVTYEIRCER